MRWYLKFLRKGKEVKKDLVDFRLFPTSSCHQSFAPKMRNYALNLQ